MAKTINIFCVIAKTGSQKSIYVNDIIRDRNFMKKCNLTPMVYGTTRKMRANETDGIDYFFHTKEQYEKIQDDDLIESRSYYTLQDGLIYYFTKNEYIERIKTNMICVISPYQYENYKMWCARENIKSPNKYKLFVIFVDASIKKRINRIMGLSQGDETIIYEMCRRLIQEKNEFDDVSKRITEISDPKSANNVCYIDNNSANTLDIAYNIEKVRGFLRRYAN